MMHSIRRIAGFTLASLLLAACSDGGPTGGSEGGLRVVVAGLPNGVAASVTVTGPGAFSRALSGTEELTDLRDGTYVVVAEAVTSGGDTWGALQPSQAIEVSGAGVKTATVTYANAASGLTVRVRGLPTGAAGTVTITGPGGFSETLSSGGLLPGLAPGTYEVTASGVAVGDSTYQAKPVSQTVVVSGNAAASLDVTYSAVAQRALNLTIATMYLVQSIQTREGAVPLVADREGWIRVFAVSNQTNTAMPRVRVRLYHGAAEVATYLINASSPSVATGVDQGGKNTSWNVKVPAALIQPGMRLLAEVDPGNGVVEAAEQDNSFPTTGTPVELTVHEMPPFRIRFVPVQTADGRRGNLTATNLDSYLSLTRKIHPIAEMQAEVRETYTTRATTFDTGGNVWASVVSELDAVRVAEAGNPMYYYGVVNPPYNGGGVVGIANGIPSRTSLGWDRFPDAPETVAHELGHNFGRYHAPCGGAGGSDPDFPYPQGLISNYGMDSETGDIKGPNEYTDIMGYCETSWWISDYTFTNILHYRRQADGPVSGGRSLLVWGRVGADELVLEPAFEVRARAEVPRAGGPYRIEGMDANGARLFSYSFAGAELGDGPEGVRTFAFALPGEVIGMDRLATVRLSGHGRTVTMQAGTGGEPLPRGPVGPFLDAELRRVDSGTVALRWDAARHPMVMVRNPDTGNILSFARGGETRVASGAGELELVYSDGVRSVAQRMAVER